MATSAIDQQLQRALQARAAGRRSEALQLLQQVIAVQPDQPVARNVLGLEAMATNDAAAAADHFAAALRSEPTAIPVWLNLAGAHRVLGRGDEEQQALLAVLEIDQRQLSALIRLAELHERRGEQHEAAMRWSGVVALASQHDDPPPALQERFTHARAFMAAHTQQLGATIDQALAADLAAASERDRRRIRAAADVMLGRRPVYTNQCEGMNYPFLPADEYFDRGHFPWLGQLEAATDVIRAELLGILGGEEPGLAPYVAMAPGTPENKWSRLDRKLDWSALHLWREGVRDEAACAKAPRTVALVEQLPLCRIAGRAPTVFFSLLKAGSNIPPHTGVTNTRAIVHLPLIVPAGCEFRVGGEIRPWVEGTAFAFDDTIEHEAWNPTPHDRAVLIIDVWNPHLSTAEQAMIVRLFEAADAARAGG